MAAADSGGRFQPEVVLLYCRQALAPAAPPPQGNRGGDGFTTQLVMLPCSSKLELPNLLDILAHGADAVLVAACPAKTCRFLVGNQRAEKRKTGQKHRPVRTNNAKHFSARMISAHINAIADQLHAQEEQQNRQSQEGAYREIGNLVLAGIAGIAAIGAACFAGWSAFIFQGQLDEMRNESRPWMAIDSVQVLKVTMNKNGLNIGMRFNLVNKGKTPAQHIFISPQIVIPDFFDDTTTQRQVCSDSVNSWKNVTKIDSVVFPGADYHEESDGFMPIDRIMAEQERDIANLQAVREETKTSPLPQGDIDMRKRVAPFAIVGCVSYDFGGGGRVHQTGFVFILSAQASRPYGPPIDALINIHSVGSKEGGLYFWPAPYGAFAN